MLSQEIVQENLQLLLKDLKQLNADIKDLEERKEGVRELVWDTLKEGGITEIVEDGFSVKEVPAGVSRKLDKKKLIQLGVTPDIIEKATSESPRKAYVSIKAVKDGSD